MAKEVDVLYGVMFGSGDGSDMIESSVELTDEEEKIYDRDVMLRLPLNEDPDLQEALDRAREACIEAEMDSGCYDDDEFYNECMGYDTMSPSYINSLVEDRDQHTLQFFGLTDLSDEELDEWDAYNEDMPQRCDFDEEFVAENPFENGWTMIVEFVDPYDESDFTAEEAKSTLTQLLQEGEGSYGDILDYVERMEEAYDEAGDAVDLKEMAMAIAEEQGITDFTIEE